jgi:hypothetical protein
MTIRSFSDKNDFSITVRLMRVLQRIVKHFHATMPMEGEIFLSLLGKLAEPDVAPFWQRAIVLEIYRDLCLDIELLRSIFQLFDQKEDSANIFQEIIECLGRFILLEKTFLTSDSPRQYALSIAASSIKMQSIDQLDKTDPPSLPESYLIYLALTGISNMVWILINSY